MPPRLTRVEMAGVPKGALAFLCANSTFGCPVTELWRD
jgi:hypothetical protein